MSDDGFDDEPKTAETQPLKTLDSGLGEHTSASVQVVHLNGDDRVETGPTKFIHESGYEDWTGLFIRGDNALGHALHLEKFMGVLDILFETLDVDVDSSNHPALWFGKMQVNELIELLMSVDE